MLDRLVTRALNALAKKRRVYRYRSAVTGKWVSPAFGKENPALVVRERVG